MPSHRTSQASPRLAADASSVVNVTVDDKYGDENTNWVPLYLPNGGWSQGPECSGCALNSTIIDPRRVMRASWHDSTYHPGNETREISIDFIGTAVYVYHIVVNHPPIPAVTVFTSLSFLIDNATVGNYTHSPDPHGLPVLYDVPVYVNRTLTNEKHTLRIRSGGPTDTLILFDYIQYTVDSSSTSRPSSSQTGSFASSSPFDGSTGLPTHTQPTVSPEAARLKPGIIAAIAVPLGLTAAVVLLVLLIRSRARVRSHKPADDERHLMVVPFQERPDGGSSTSFRTPPEVPPEVPQASRTALSWSRPSARPAKSPPPRTPAYKPHRPPPRHRVDVPAPALSATGTERSLRYMELVGELAALETMVRAMEDARAARSRTTGATSQPESDQRYTPAHDVRLTSIRSQVKRVRALIEDERRLMEEALPRSQR